MDVKRSVTLAGHRTSVALEAEFWDALKEIARTKGLSQNVLIGEIDAARLDGEAPTANLSRAIRLYILRYYQERTTP